MKLQWEYEYRYLKNNDEFYSTRLEIWSQLMEERDYRRFLVYSMVDRIGALLASEGGFTKR